jgi:hypothetical protein
VVPRRRVCARDVVESVSKKINEKAPRAVFIQELTVFERMIEELLVRAQIQLWRCLWLESSAKGMEHW